MNGPHCGVINISHNVHEGEPKQSDTGCGHAVYMLTVSAYTCPCVCVCVCVQVGASLCAKVFHEFILFFLYLK